VAGGAYSTEVAGEKTLHFWSVPIADGGSVFIGVIDYTEAGGGILEVGMSADFPDFDAFCDQIRSAESDCSDTGLVTRDISTSGDSIQYDRGTATVNARPFDLKEYATYECPLAKSIWDEGIMEFSVNGQSLRLDARDLNHPRREIEMSSARRAP